MYWLVNNQLVEFAKLPIGGDTSYLGFVTPSPLRAIMSWYSTHKLDQNRKRMTTSYLADLTIDK